MSITPVAVRRGFPTRALTIALCALGLTAATTAQSKIRWLTVKDIKDKTDVSTGGELCLAVNLGPETCATVINGVHFQADRGHWAPKILTKNGPVTRGVMYWPDQKSGGFTLNMPWQRAAGMGNGVTPDQEYNFALSSGKHIRPGNFAHVNTITGLTPGNTYQIQLWCAHKDPKLVEWDDGQGGREGKGGIFMTTANATKGQVATGIFTAGASGSQTFTCYDQDPDNTQNPPLKGTWGLLNMFQLRDISTNPRPARATYYGLGLPGTQRGGRGGEYGGTNCSPAIALTDHPVRGKPVKLTVENSSGAPSAAIVVIGAASLSVPVFSGTLLVRPDLALGVPMPFTIGNGMKFTQDHELQIPLVMPNVDANVYVQVLQLDPKAAKGFSFTAGMKIAIGL